MKDDLGIDQRAQVHDSAMFVLSFDVAQLVLVPTCFTLAWLCDGESLDVGEPQPGHLTPSIVTSLLAAHNKQQLGDLPKRAMSSCWSRRPPHLIVSLIYISLVTNDEYLFICVCLFFGQLYIFFGQMSIQIPF